MFYSLFRKVFHYVRKRIKCNISWWDVKEGLQEYRVFLRSEDTCTFRYVCLLGYCIRTDNEFAYYRRMFQRLYDSCTVFHCFVVVAQNRVVFHWVLPALVIPLLFLVVVIMDTGTGVLHVAEACYIWLYEPVLLYMMKPVFSYVWP